MFCLINVGSLKVILLVSDLTVNNNNEHNHKFSFFIFILDRSNFIIIENPILYIVII